MSRPPRQFNTLNLTGEEGVTMTGSGWLTLLGSGLIGNSTGSITGGTLAGSARRRADRYYPAQPYDWQCHRRQRRHHGIDQGRIGHADSYR